MELCFLSRLTFSHLSSLQQLATVSRLFSCLGFFNAIPVQYQTEMNYQGTDFFSSLPEQNENQTKYTWNFQLGSGNINNPT